MAAKRIIEVDGVATDFDVFKRGNIIRVFLLLQKYTNEDKPLLPKDIELLFKKEYGAEIEPRALQRALVGLQQLFSGHKFYDMVWQPRIGIYVKRLFSDSELKLLIDGVLASRHIPEKDTSEIIKKLRFIAPADFKDKILYVDVAKRFQGKKENDKFFTNLDIINTAIENGKQIRFNYNQIGAKLKYSKLDSYIVSPYHTLIHNQHYFLISLNEAKKEQRNFRLDKMSDVEILEEPATLAENVEGFLHVEDYKTNITAYPYMFTDKPRQIVFWTTYGMLSELVDWFGKNFEILTEEEDRLMISLSASPMAMEKWTLHYTPDVEILSPPELRVAVKEDLEKAVLKYK